MPGIVSCKCNQPLFHYAAIPTTEGMEIHMVPLPITRPCCKRMYAEALEEEKAYCKETQMTLRIFPIGTTPKWAERAR
jgi:hypothetical protein